MTFTDDDRIIIKSIVTETLDQVMPKFKEEVANAVKIHALECQGGGISGKTAAGLTAIISSAVVGIIEGIKLYLGK